MFLTAELSFVIYILASNEENNATFMAPDEIGLAIFLAEMAGVDCTLGNLTLCRTSVHTYFYTLC